MVCRWCKKEISGLGQILFWSVVHAECIKPFVERIKSDPLYYEEIAKGSFHPIISCSNAD